MKGVKAARDYVGRVVSVLRHPLTLLVVGAVLSGLLIPSITQRWQDHQRRLDLQDQLVTTITREATEYIIAVHRARDEKRYVEKPAVETWAIESKVIESRLFAYYPIEDAYGTPTKIPNAPRAVADWLSFEEAAETFYKLAIGPRGRFARNARRLASALRRGGVLLARPPSTFHDAVRWMEVGVAVIVRDILEDPPQV